MSRRQYTDIRAVPAHEESFFVSMKKCDGGCGREIETWPRPEDDPDNWIHELIVGLDGDECAGVSIRRDYCPACLEPVWRKIAEALGIPEDFTGSQGWEDE